MQVIEEKLEQEKPKVTTQCSQKNLTTINRLENVRNLLQELSANLARIGETERQHQKTDVIPKPLLHGTQWPPKDSFLAGLVGRQATVG